MLQAASEFGLTDSGCCCKEFLLYSTWERCYNPGCGVVPFPVGAGDREPDINSNDKGGAEYAV